MNVGIVGCGVISKTYAEHAGAFDSFQLVACADLVHESAVELGKAHGLAVASIDELLADPAIDVVLNLTPSGAHGAVTRAALEAGKHVYTEKPLAIDVPEGHELLALADRLGLRIGCAPDIFLGSAFQAARAVIDEGGIGEPLAVSAAMLVGGPNAWHPNPEQFFSDGAGPLLDMGPYYVTAIVALLGPVRRVAGFTSMRQAEREIMSGPRAGERFAVTTPTHASATMELDGGVTASLVASFEPTARYICDFEVHGTDTVALAPRSQRIPRRAEEPSEPRRLGGDPVHAARSPGDAGHRPARHGRGDRRGPRPSRLGPAGPPRDRRRPQHPPGRRRGADGHGRDERRAARAAADSGRRHRRLGN